MDVPENQEPGSDPEPEQTPAGSGGGGSDPTSADPTAADPSVDEAELRRRIEEGLREVRVQDVVLESVVTFINLTARRIGKTDERDLEQAKVGIEAVRALVDLLEPEPQAQVRNALSELQMLYAQHSGGGGATEAGGRTPGGEGGTPAGGGAAGTPERPPAPGRKPGGGDAPPGLWVPGRS
ncbi:MAG: hypothetical protein ACR2G3_10060 [Solirubrobacterales bacterium]